MPLTKIDKKMITNIMQEYKMHNCHVTLRGDYDVDDLIDVIEGNRKYVKCIYFIWHKHTIFYNVSFEHNKYSNLTWLIRLFIYSRYNFSYIRSCILERALTIF